MSWSDFPTDSGATLVADSSVVINLNATGRAADILSALGNPVVVPDSVRRELKDGDRNGHGDADALEALIRSGHVRLVALGSTAYGIYESLIDGSTEYTLDDGEAATVACAIDLSGVALIDERKALRLCSQLFPGLAIVPTIALFLHAEVSKALGQAGQADAVFGALQHARMRVPPAFLPRAIALVGAERARSCASIPRYAFREASAA